MNSAAQDKISPSREVWRLAWPAILTNVTAPLMSLVDTAVVGHLGNASYIAGIALGGAVFNMLYWLLNFLRTGTSGLTGQAVGRHDSAAAVQLLRRMATPAIIAGVAIIAFSHPLFDMVMRFMDAEASAVAPAQSYFFIAVWGAPAVLLGYVLSGWFVGEQDTRPILVMALISNGINAVLSPLLAFGAGLSIAGVAAATAISQWIALAAGAIMLRAFVRRRHISLTHKPKTAESAPVPWRRLVNINSDIFLRTLCLVAVTLWFTRAGARISTVVLAANAVLMQLFMLFSFFIDGFAFAGEALAGRDFGARDKKRLGATVRALFIWGTIMATACSIIYFVCGQAMVNILTDSLPVRAAASEAMLWIVAVPLCGFMAFTWDGIFIGMTLTKRMLISMAISMAVFFAIYFATTSWGIHGLWLAFLSYLASRGLAQTLLYRHYRLPA